MSDTPDEAARLAHVHALLELSDAILKLHIGKPRGDLLRAMAALTAEVVVRAGVPASAAEETVEIFAGWLAHDLARAAEIFAADQQETLQ